MKKVYILLGEPVPLKRPRMSSTHVYNPQSIAMDNARVEIMSQLSRDYHRLEGPLTIEITYYMPIPARFKNAKKLPTIINKPHHCKPDIDNLCKWTLDAAHCLYKDDAQIAVITARKIYSTEPRTEFTIESME